MSTLLAPSPKVNGKEAHRLLTLQCQCCVPWYIIVDTAMSMLCCVVYLHILAGHTHVLGPAHTNKISTPAATPSFHPTPHGHGPLAKLSSRYSAGESLHIQTSAVKPPPAQNSSQNWFGISL